MVAGKAQWSSCHEHGQQPPQISSEQVVAIEIKPERELGYDPQNLTCSDQLLPARPHP